MRLSPHELQTVRDILSSADANGKIWLFGSRVDNSKRGGDIDVYLEASQPINLKASLALEYKLTSLCDVKVDLLIRNPGEPEQLIHSIAKKGIPL
jgi:predicted nucleotidyltransferase